MKSRKEIYINKELLKRAKIAAVNKEMSFSGYIEHLIQQNTV